MSGATKIEWTDATWNPIRARLKRANVRMNTGKLALPAGTWGYHCERVSPGCGHPSTQPKGGGCYACAMNGRAFPAWGTGLDYTRQSRDLVEIYLDEEELLKPLKWKKPRLVFPCSMTDLFAEFVPDDFIDKMLAVMAITPRHTYQVLTKRAQRLPDFFRDLAFRQEMLGISAELWSGLDRHYDGPGSTPGYGVTWKLPFPNVWLGVSVEDQQRADERIPHLLRTPAAMRWVSYEPALGPVDFTALPIDSNPDPGDQLGLNALTGEFCHYDEDSGDPWSHWGTHLDWVVAGGESGHGARPLDLAWLRSLREQCARANVPLFIKQLGRDPREGNANCNCRDLYCTHPDCGYVRLRLKDRKGGDMAEWPADLRVRQMPGGRA